MKELLFKPAYQLAAIADQVTNVTGGFRRPPGY
jgi:hypothetical protein